MGLFRPLRDVSLRDLTECGGKAARLGEAIQLGCPVLPGVVFPTPLYRRFMRQGGLQGEIASILATMQPSTMTHFQAAEWAIQSAFRVRRMPDEARHAIAEAWRSLGGGPVAVRSSATNEDSPEQSFVGQHATYLNVDSEETAVAAVAGCWTSLFSAKALSYAQRFGVDLLSSSMAVLMQPMIATSSRGALFTVDPISGTPDVFVLEVLEGPEAGVYSLDPYERRPEESRLWGQLRKVGLLLDEHLASYQAIEWSVAEDDRLLLLRIRPVTGVPSHLPLSGADVGAGRGPLELVCRPDCTPRATRPHSWYHRSRASRLNAAHFGSVNRLFAPYSGRDDFYLCGYLYSRWRRFPFPGLGSEAGSLRRFVHGLRRLHAARTLDREYRILLCDERPRLDTLSQRDISVLSRHELSGHLQEVMALHEAFWEECGRLAQTVDALTEALCQLHEHWLHDSRDCQALLWTGDDQLTRCSEELCELARREPANETRHEEAFRAFFRRYRHLFLGERPLAQWQDTCALQAREARAREALHEWLDNDQPSLRTQNAAHAAERDMAERRTFSRLGLVRRAVYRYVLSVARRYAPLRTNLEEPALLCRLLERDVVCEVGDRLRLDGLVSDRDDACLLGCREIIDWLEGRTQSEELVRLVTERKDLLRRWSRYAPPSVLADEIKPPAIEIGLTGPPENILRGRAVSPGLTLGRARIVNTLGGATNVLPGEVLVCREPLFELSPLFSIVSGVVAEKGGLLDHAAVLAREYGIPAVFGVEDATSRIRTGDELRIDANNGVVVRTQQQAERDSRWLRPTRE